MKTVYFDVDETLLLWDKPQGDTAKNYKPCREIAIFNLSFYVHEVHLARLILHHCIGDKVVVWSGGGEAWAREVVTRLAIEKSVDVILSKPDFYYDDKNFSEFKGNYLYFNLNGSLKTVKKEGLRRLLSD